MLGNFCEHSRNHRALCAILGRQSPPINKWKRLERISLPKFMLACSLVAPEVCACKPYFVSIKDNPIQATSEHLPETTRPVHTKSLKTLESCWNFNASVSQSGIRFHLPLPPFPHASSQTFEPQFLIRCCRAFDRPRCTMGC